jgi:hypothetical protein
MQPFVSVKLNELFIFRRDYIFSSEIEIEKYNRKLLRFTVYLSEGVMVIVIDSMEEERKRERQRERETEREREKRERERMYFVPSLNIYCFDSRLLLFQFLKQS